MQIRWFSDCLLNYGKIFFSSLLFGQSGSTLKNLFAVFSAIIIHHFAGI